MAFLRHISSLKEHDDLLQSKKDTLVVLDFHAQWCGPCHQIAPLFDQLSQTHRHATFAKVDIDHVQAVAQKYNVSSIPTFVFIKNLAVVDTLRGANPAALETMVSRHLTDVPRASGSGTGTADEASGDISLLEFVDPSQVNCLNESAEHTIKSIVKNKSPDAYLLSDADEQLLMNITFNQIVKVKSLSFHTLPAHTSQGPKSLKLIINKPSLGFDDFEDSSALTQELELSEEDVKEGKRVGVRFVRFQSVTTLSIFVASNQNDEDETRIDAIDVFGLPVQTTRDLSGLRKQEEGSLG